MAKYLLALLLCAVSANAAITFDAQSSTTATTEDLSWTHTAGASPEGVIVLIAEEVLATQVQDGVVGVTYGGVAMTEFSVSPMFHAGNSVDDSGSVHAFYLRASVPTGTSQTVAVDGSVARSKGAACYTLQTAGSFKIVDLDNSLNTVTTTTGVSVTLGGNVSFVCIVAGVGFASTLSMAPWTDWTSTVEPDHGSGSALIYRKNSLSANDTSAGYTNGGSDDAYMIAIVVADSTPSGGATPQSPRRRKMLIGWINIEPPVREIPAIWYDRKWTG